VVEISVDSAKRAAAAEQGGADRIELCSALDVGGLTPRAELMRETRARVKIPIFSMVRPRAGNFVYSDAEIAAMRKSIAEAKSLGMKGVVLGLLRPDGRVDVERTRELVELARPLPVTFHRAFDEVRHPTESLGDVIETGAARILTSGGMRTAVAGCEQLAELVRLARGRIVVLPGGGIHARNVDELVRKTEAAEVHAALSSVVNPSDELSVFVAEVKRLTERVNAVANS
jgi:copper homeostasis protein